GLAGRVRAGDWDGEARSGEADGLGSRERSESGEGEEAESTGFTAVKEEEGEGVGIGGGRAGRTGRKRRAVGRQGSEGDVLNQGLGGQGVSSQGFNSQGLSKEGGGGVVVRRRRMAGFNLRVVLNAFAAPDTGRPTRLNNRWLKRLKRWKTSILVLSRTPAFGDKELMLQEVRDTLEAVRDLYPDMLVIWRSAVGGHPSCQHFTRPLRTRPALLAAKGKIPDVWLRHAEMNAAIKPLLKEYGVVYMDVDSATSLRPDGHHSRMDGSINCHHYCMPGPLDHWVSLFHNLLLLLDQHSPQSTLPASAAAAAGGGGGAAVAGGAAGAAGAGGFGGGDGFSGSGFGGAAGGSGSGGGAAGGVPAVKVSGVVGEGGVVVEEEDLSDVPRGGRWRSKEEIEEEESGREDGGGGGGMVGVGGAGGFEGAGTVGGGMGVGGGLACTNFSACIPGTRIRGEAAVLEAQQEVSCVAEDGKWVRFNTPRWLPWSRDPHTNPRAPHYGTCDLLHVNETGGKGMYGFAADKFRKNPGDREWHVRAELKYQWKASRFCPPFMGFNRHKFCAAVGQRNVLLVGDTTQLALHDVFLNHVTTIATQKEIGDIADAWTAPNNQPACATNNPHVVCSDIVPGGFTFRVAHNNLLTPDSPGGGAFNQRWLGHLRKWNVSIVVLNKGFERRPTPVYLKTLRQTLTKFRQVAPDTLLIWRSTWRGHEGCENATEPLAAPPDNATRAGPWAFVLEQNEAVRDVIREFGGVYMNLDASLSMRPDGHLRQLNGLTDCYYYCLPGPVDHFMRLFYNYLIILDSKGPRTSHKCHASHSEFNGKSHFPRNGHGNGYSRWARDASGASPPPSASGPNRASHHHDGASHGKGYDGRYEGRFEGARCEGRYEGRYGRGYGRGDFRGYAQSGSERPASPGSSPSPSSSASPFASSSPPFGQSAAANSPSSPANATSSPDSNAAAGGAASGEFPFQSHHTILDVDPVDPTAGDAAWGGLDAAAAAAAWKRSFLKRVVDTITDSKYFNLQTAGWLMAGAATAAVGVQVTAHIIKAIESVPLLASLEILIGAAVTTNVATTIAGGREARERLEQQWDEFVRRVSGTYGLSDPVFDEMESGKDLECSALIADAALQQSEQRPSHLEGDTSGETQQQREVWAAEGLRRAAEGLGLKAEGKAESKAEVNTGKETEGEELKETGGKQGAEADSEAPQRKAEREEGEEAVVAVRKAELVRVLSEFVERREGRARRVNRMLQQEVQAGRGLEERLGDLTKALEVRTLASVAAAQNVARLQALNDSLQAERNSVTSQLSALTNQITGLSTSLDVLTRQQDSVSQSNTVLRARLRKALLEKRQLAQSLRAAHRVQSERASDVEGRLRAVGAQLKASEGAMLQQRREEEVNLQTYLSQHAAIKSERNAAVVQASDLERRVASAEAQLKEVTRSRDQLFITNHELNTRLTAAMTENRLLQQRVDQLQRTSRHSAAAFRDREATLKQHLAERHAELAASRQQAAAELARVTSSLEAKVRATQEDLEESKGEVRWLEEQRAAQEEVEESKGEVKWQEEQRAAQEEVDESKGEVRWLEEQVEALREEGQLHTTRLRAAVAAAEKRAQEVRERRGRRCAIAVRAEEEEAAAVSADAESVAVGADAGADAGVAAGAAAGPTVGAEGSALGTPNEAAGSPNKPLGPPNENDLKVYARAIFPAYVALDASIMEQSRGVTAMVQVWAGRHVWWQCMYAGMVCMQVYLQVIFPAYVALDASIMEQSRGVTAMVQVRELVVW
ncbi:unnamed protein product, partial [Closterium sp. Yama58-4]